MSEFDQRFMSKVSPEPNTGCWLWVAAVGSHGYGAFGIGTRVVNAHRYAWEQANDESLGARFVLHRCDNRICVNPAHLFAGTHSDNMRDMWAKGRGRTSIASHRPSPECLPRGMSHGMARLTDADVVAIRDAAAHGEPQRSIGRRFGVTQASISLIVRREQWSHVP